MAVGWTIVTSCQLTLVVVKRVSPATGVWATRVRIMGEEGDCIIDYSALSEDDFVSEEAQQAERYRQEEQERIQQEKKKEEEERLIQEE